MTTLFTNNPLAYVALVRKLTPALQAAIVGYAAALQNEIAPYPPASAANRPNALTGRWYERGYGPRWLRLNGSAGGARTSQLLNRSWSLGRTSGGARLSNRATYSGWVHGDQQVAFHARRGWKTVQQGVEALEEQRILFRLVAQASKGAVQ